MATIKLTPASGKIAGTSHANMPLAIIPSEVTNLGSLTQAEADSSRIYTDSGLVTEIPREITSNNEVHTKVTNLDSSSELYFDHDSIRADYAVTATYGRNAVWSDYLTVFHMNDATSTTSTDSSGSFDLTKFAASKPSEIAGKVDKAQDFTTSDSYMATAQSSTINTTGVKTIQMWLKLNNLLAQDGFFGINSGINGGALDVIFQKATGTSGLRFQQFDGGSKTVNLISSPTTGVWYHLHGTFDGSNMRGYLNGSITGTTLSGASFNHGANALLQVRRSTLAGTFQADEARFRKSALSTDWITTEYNNQNDNAAFWVATDVSATGFVGFPMIHMLQFNCVM